MTRIPETQWGPIAVVGALAVAASSLFFIRSPLESQRPSEPAARMMTSSGEEVVMARLWQDPLHAIQGHWNSFLSTSETDRHTRSAGVQSPVTLKAFNSNVGSSGPQLRLLVMLPGTPYVEDREQRRRQRYAVVSALTEHGLIPSNADHIGYVVAPSLNESTGLPILIGFEEYKRAFEEQDDATTQESWKSVIVFWLNAQDFDPYPLTAVSALTAALDKAVGERSTTTTVLFGPVDSATLVAMKEDPEISTNAGRPRVLQRFLRMAANCDIEHYSRHPPEPGRGTETNADADCTNTADSAAESDTSGARSWVGSVVALIDDYLDDGLPEEAASELQDCLENGERLETCLERNVFATIVDSDANWRQTVVAIFSPSVINLIDDYLDDGLPEEAASELRDCLENGERLETCLEQDVFEAIEDSDRNWRETVVDALSASEAEDDSEWSSQRRRLHIVSPLATAPLHWLFKNNPELRIRRSSQASDVESSFARQLGVASFRSVVARDDLVLRDILLELEARGACRQDRPTIAIVSEQDTVYGQILDDVMNDIIADGGMCEFTVLEFGYLRGVDGELPPEGLAPVTSPATTANPIPADRENDGERAFGPHQLDYIRRFADEIGRSVDDTENRTLVAIGILGSDVYDKLLILQSLRERLPWVAYFTTDLDARLLDLNSGTSTRNVIVGSAYGFTVGQRDGAQFRDSYQTALYRGVTQALRPDPGSDGPGVGDMPAALAPRIFEIGRLGPVDITTCWETSRPCRAMWEAHGSDRQVTLNPRVWNRAGPAALLLLPLLGLILVAVVMLLVLNRKTRVERRKAHGIVALIGGVSVIGLVTLIDYWIRSADEPSKFFEGISSVPTAVLHIVTIVFSVGIATIATGRMRQGEGDACQDFRLSRDEDEKVERPWMFRSTMTWSTDLAAAKDGTRTKVKDIWSEYLLRNSWRARLVRIAPISVITTLVVCILAEQQSDALLTRLYLVADLAEWFAVAAVITTMFYCTDAFNLAQVMIRELARRNVVEWPSVEESPDAARKSSHKGLDEHVSDRWWTMDLVVRCSEIIGPIVVFPLFPVVLLMLARATVFEGWRWTWPLVAVYTAIAVYIVVHAVRFQNEAGRARDRILQDLDTYRHEVSGDERRLRRVQMVKEEIEGLRRGAFVPWTRHPILASVALPFSGIGFMLLEAFLWSGR